MSSVLRAAWDRTMATIYGQRRSQFSLERVTVLVKKFLPQLPASGRHDLVLHRAKPGSSRLALTDWPVLFLFFLSSCAI